MKYDIVHRYIKQIVSVGLIAFVLNGCIKDESGIIRDPVVSNGMRVEFSLRVPAVAAPSSRAMTVNDEYHVETIDILAFDGTDDFIYRVEIPNSQITTAGSEHKFVAALPVSTSDVRFVFLANAADIITAAYGSAGITGNYASVQEKLISQSTGKWQTDPAAYLPMWGEKTFQVTNTTNPETVVLTRMQARVNVRSADTNFQMKEVHVFRPMDRGYLIPKPGVDIKKIPSLANGWSRLSNPLEYSGAQVTGNKCENEIYIYESEAGSKDDCTFIVVGGTLGNDQNIYYYRIDFAVPVTGSPYTYEYLPILRNHKYDLTITNIGYNGESTAEEAARLTPLNTVQLTVENDFELKHYTFNDQYFLGAEDEEVFYPWMGSDHKLAVKTDHPDGWSISKVTDRDDNPILGGWITASHTDDRTLTLTFTQNDETALRTAIVHLTSGDLTLPVLVRQLPNWTAVPHTNLSYPYVGAFWKANQTGERLINIKTSLNGSDTHGAWIAMVVEGMDWIKMDTKKTTDPNVWGQGSGEPADMNNARNDAQHQLMGGKVTVAGTADAQTDIYFRIGLRDTYTPAADAPARYGVILLCFNNYTKYSYLFVRQGEEADYLMRNGTQDAGITITNRTVARKFSPYNLTSSEYLASAAPNQKKGGGTKNGHSQIGGSATQTDAARTNAAFTEYPSQAGAYFQWANTVNNRYAWHPSNPTFVVNQLLGINGWNKNDPTDYWTSTNPTLESQHETCPPGYRRPNDGVTDALNRDGPVAGSEFRESLWLNPEAGEPIYSYNHDNCLWGYYADGHFDRWAIVDVPDEPNKNSQNSAVCTDEGDYRTAYVGSLFYNPNTNASLFFPAAGYRHTWVENTGYLTECGAYGSYWTSSTSTSFTLTWGWSMQVGMTLAHTSAPRYHGFTIRCIKDEH